MVQLELEISRNLQPWFLVQMRKYTEQLRKSIIEKLDLGLHNIRQYTEIPTHFT